MAANILLTTNDHPNTRTKRKVVLGEATTDPRTGAVSALTMSQTKLGDLLDFQYLASDTKRKDGRRFLSGWHSQGANPRCQVAFVSPKGVVSFCEHDSHNPAEAGVTDVRTVDDRRRCRKCSDYLEPKRVGRGPGKSLVPVCVDSAGCATRQAALYKKYPKLQEIADRRTAALAVVSIEGDGAPTQPRPARARSGKTPRECKCGCGEMTKGGLFRPGHDAKYHAAQKRAAQ